jgi:hypothetical protein
MIRGRLQLVGSFSSTAGPSTKHINRQRIAIPMRHITSICSRPTSKYGSRYVETSYLRLPFLFFNQMPFSSHAPTMTIMAVAYNCLRAHSQRPIEQQPNLATRCFSMAHLFSLEMVILMIALAIRPLNQVLTAYHFGPNWGYQNALSVDMRYPGRLATDHGIMTFIRTAFTSPPSWGRTFTVDDSQDNELSLLMRHEVIVGGTPRSSMFLTGDSVGYLINAAGVGAAPIAIYKSSIMGVFATCR